MGKGNSMTRYQRVQQILDEAQGHSIPDYQGLGAFWRDLESFKTAELYGQRLIAPEAGEQTGDGKPAVKKSCCGGKSSVPADNSLTADEQGLTQALLASGSNA